MVKVMDLFAGAGGIGVGCASVSGVELSVSVEMDARCCETLRANKKHHPGLVIEGDVSELHGADLRDEAGIDKDEPVVVVGGPPCQPFSKAAYWTDPGDDAKYRRARAKGQKASKPKPITEARPDERRDLVQCFLDHVLEAEADGFVFENVPSLLHPRNREIAERFVSRANASGYKTLLLKANAVEYGVAQMRKRVLILGSKHDQPLEPAKTHATCLEEAESTGLLPPVSAGEALIGLGAQEYHEPEEVVTGKWAEALHEVLPGWNYKYLTEWNNHPWPLFEAETRFWSFLLKLHPDRPSWTVAANPGPWVGPFHWSSRRLRTVEMAALQSFPRGYTFKGNRRERVRQVGNAAPPLLIKPMLESVMATLPQLVEQHA